MLGMFGVVMVFAPTITTAQGGGREPITLVLSKPNIIRKGI